MDNKYFSCSIPDSWALERDQKRDERYKIYEIQLLAPKADKAPTSIFVSFFAKDNADFNDYQDYIDSNSKNALGETKSARENYEPVKKMKLGGRAAFELSSEAMKYLHPQSKSDESVQLKTKMYVLPAKEGFYVLRFSAAKTAFLEHQAVFEKIAKSFKGNP
jgi:polyhydroxyalkanoate synthesis regulator protein